MIDTFAYRKPRLTANLPVEFLTSAGVLFGVTRDVSEGGLAVDFQEPVLRETAGLLRFRVGHCVLELQAEVTHAEGFMSGLAFAFSSEKERLLIHALLQALAHAMGDDPKRFT